ncbi:MAG: hypothetical protein DWQ01_11300 [Planctomycetota bacterium]|nr:MAG: hypothetical protein DWQ01_11300 [Planctomycetota bacterium]
MAVVLCLMSTALPASGQQWDTEELSSARQYIAAASVGDLAMFAGGYDPALIATDTVDVYDVVSQQWSLAQLSVARHSCAAATVGDQVLFAGGVELNGPFTGQQSDVVDLYDHGSGTWSTMQLAQPRTVGAVATLGSRAFFAGGQTATGFSDVVEIYDETTGQWSSESLSMARSSLTAVSAGSFVFFAGGSDGQPYGETALVDVFDTASGIWKTAQLSEPRAFLAATAVGDLVLFAGGWSLAAGYSKTVDILDLQTGRWKVSELSTARANIGAITVGDYAVFAGGNGLDSVDIFDSNTGGWCTAKLSVPRYEVSACNVQGQAFFAGGMTTRVDIYQPFLGSPNLSVQNLIAGGQVTLVMQGATPNGLVGFLYSLTGPGPSQMFSNCGWMEVSLSQPVYILPDQADAAGTAVEQGYVVSGTSGWPIWLQGFDVTTCQLSNCLSEVIR